MPAKLLLYLFAAGALQQAVARRQSVAFRDALQDHHEAPRLGSQPPVLEKEELDRMLKDEAKMLKAEQMIFSDDSVDDVPAPKPEEPEKSASPETKPILKKAPSKLKKSVTFHESADPDPNCVAPRTKPLWDGYVNAAFFQTTSPKLCDPPNQFIARNEAQTRYCCAAKPDSKQQVCEFIYLEVLPALRNVQLSSYELSVSGEGTSKYKKDVEQHQQLFEYYDYHGFCNEFPDVVAQKADPAFEAMQVERDALIRQNIQETKAKPQQPPPLKKVRFAPEAVTSTCRTRVNAKPHWSQYMQWVFLDSRSPLCPPGSPYLTRDADQYCCEKQPAPDSQAKACDFLLNTIGESLMSVESAEKGESPSVYPIFLKRQREIYDWYMDPANKACAAE